MPTVKLTLDPANPPRLSLETEARMAAMTPEQIEANAASDPENPPLTEDELRRLNKARFIRETRKATGLPQEVFAREYLITPGRLRDLEQGRTEPDGAFLAYMALILHSPEGVKSTLSANFSEAGDLRLLPEGYRP